ADADKTQGDVTSFVRGGGRGRSGGGRGRVARAKFGAAGRCLGLAGSIADDDDPCVGLAQGDLFGQANCIGQGAGGVGLLNCVDGRIQSGAVGGQAAANRDSRGSPDDGGAVAAAEAGDDVAGQGLGLAQAGSGAGVAGAHTGGGIDDDDGAA